MQRVQDEDTIFRGTNSNDNAFLVIVAVHLLHSNQGINLIGQLNDKGPTHTILLTVFPSNRAQLPFCHALDHSPQECT
jgi:hypothetical protein